MRGNFIWEKEKYEYSYNKRMNFSELILNDNTDEEVNIRVNMWRWKNTSVLPQVRDDFNEDLCLLI